MTLAQHIYAVKNIVANGPASDDSPFSERLVAHFLQITRAYLIERKADRYRFISDQSFQSVCLELEEGSFHNCCNVPELKCTVLKSVIKLPKLLNTKWGNFLKVMDLGGTIISEFNLTNSKFAVHGILPANVTAGWFLHDGYLYVIHTKKLEKILVNGLFTDSSEIAQINCATGTATNCADYGSEDFPIDSDLIDAMYKATLEYLLRSTSLPNDLENNARDIETTNAKQ